MWAVPSGDSPDKRRCKKETFACLLSPLLASSSTLSLLLLHSFADSITQLHQASYMDWRPAAVQESSRPSRLHWYFWGILWIMLLAWGSCPWTAQTTSCKPAEEILSLFYQPAPLKNPAYYTGSYGCSSFNFSSYIRIGFHSGYTSLHCHHQCTKHSPTSRKHLLIFVFLMILK